MPIQRNFICRKCNARSSKSDCDPSDLYLVMNPSEKTKSCKHEWEAQTIWDAFGGVLELFKKAKYN